MREDTVIPLHEPTSIDEKTIQFKSGEENIPVIVRSSGEVKVEAAPSNNQTNSNALKNVSIVMEAGSGQILVGFADKKADFWRLEKQTLLRRKNKWINTMPNFLRLRV